MSDFTCNNSLNSKVHLLRFVVDIVVVGYKILYNKLYDKSTDSQQVVQVHKT